MNFSVEVPGEANPLTPQLLYGALQSATSSQQLSIQTGAQQVRSFFDFPISSLVLSPILTFT